MIENLNYQFEEIESCECIGNFEDEYVYDLEMEDQTHTFIANDILVHNSLYINFDMVKNTLDGWDKNGEELILAIYEHRLKEYYQKCFTLYAKKRNTENIQDFELELIARSAIWLAKKKYVLNTTWKDPGIFQKSLSKVKFKGIEVVQSSTPLFSRNKIVDLIKYLLDPDVEFNQKEFAQTLKKAKEEFKLSSIDDIAKGGKIGDYEKFILNDTTNFTLAPKCPIHVRAAGWYNLTLNQNKLKSKYLMIRTGDKTKWYFTKEKECDVFAYLPNNFPMEFAPEIDYDRQFSSVMLDTINRFLKAIGQPELPPNLITIQQLFSVTFFSFALIYSLCTHTTSIVS